MEGTISTPVEAKPRPWRRWFNYALQALWVVTAAFVVQIMILSIRPGYAIMMQVCTEPLCLDGQMTTAGVENLNALGISLQAYTILQMVLMFTLATVFAGIALLIFIAKRNDSFTLYVALVLVLYGVFVTNYVDILREVHPNFATLIDILPGVTLIAFSILCYTFPDGRFVPRWTRWATAGWIIAPVILTIATVWDAYDAAEGPIFVSLLILLGTCIIAPILRYRRLSSRAQRQQLKWVLFGLAQMLMTLLVGVELLPLAFPILDVTGSFPNLVSNVLQFTSVAIFPITVGIALLRYRLWNVDMVINRTLVYVPLTSILTVIYTTSMAISQRIFIDATGQQSQAVAIFTTIILTTTFTPIKNALQSYVDKNFKEADGNLKELRELDKQVHQVVLALDHKSLAQRVVDAVVKANNAKGAALYLREGEKMVLAYATHNWAWAEGEFSILFVEDGTNIGRLLMGQRSDREDFTLDEVEDIYKNVLPIVRNMVRLTAPQDGD